MSWHSLPYPWIDFTTSLYILVTGLVVFMLSLFPSMLCLNSPITAKQEQYHHFNETNLSYKETTTDGENQLAEKVGTNRKHNKPVCIKILQRCAENYMKIRTENVLQILVCCWSKTGKWVRERERFATC